MSEDLMEKVKNFKVFLDTTIEKHNDKINQINPNDQNPNLRLICKTERGEAEMIRSQFLLILQNYL